MEEKSVGKETKAWKENKKQSNNKKKSIGVYVIHNEINLLFHTSLRIIRISNGLYNNHMRLRACEL